MSSVWVPVTDGRSLQVAREAARSLYYHLVEDYKNAKDKACSDLGMTAAPSNFQVAIELDKLADEIEGVSKRTLLLNLREVALEVMDELVSLNPSLHPKLVGSVWRGTSRKGSDIDIIVYADDTDEVVDLLIENIPDVRVESKSKTSAGSTRRYVHIFFTAAKYDTEVVVHSPEEMDARCTCEIYGDDVGGLSRRQLCELLDKDPLKTFVPKRKKGRKASRANK